MKTSLAIPVHKTASSRLPQTDFSNLVFGKTISDHMFVADYKNGEWT
ncbi:MAG TPA: branched chain amino acid aminotransferase, partial [Algoriphagus sp.]|nr:branched chain amino acid aminotransferase [Algoriphagus sp.]